MADQPKKKVLLTTKRVEEIADSLDKESLKDFSIARRAYKDNYYSLGIEADAQGKKNINNSIRYRKLAEAAKRAKINK